MLHRRSGGYSLLVAILLLLRGVAAAHAGVLLAPGGGTVRALVIGVDKYPKLGPNEQLRGAVADAEDIRAALQKVGVMATFLTDAHATRPAVVDAMNGLVNAARPGDLVVISFAGHGMRTPEYPMWKGLSRDGASEQLALSDFSFSGPGAGEVIVKIELRAWLARLDAKGVDTLVVMDCNFAGGLTRGVEMGPGDTRTRAVVGAPNASERDKFVGIEMNDREERADIEAMPRVTFLAAATSHAVTPELTIDGSPTPRGALSYFVARALEGRASVDGKVTRRRLYEYVLRNVQEATTDRQLPAISPASDDDAVLDKVVFALGGAPKPAPDLSGASHPLLDAPLRLPPAPTPDVSAAPDEKAALGRRVALIVANGAYPDAPLSNPPFDGALVQASLERIGFSVTLKRDVDLDSFERAILDFADAAKGADIALFYFAGHGFSVAAGGRQQNLLMATSANFGAKTALALQSGGEPLEHVEETIIGRARATLLFIDACRNVPTLASRGVGSRGFAALDSSAFDGSYVVLSTRQGRTASDGVVVGQGSPFARAVASVLPTPDLRIEDAYYRIRDIVRADTSGEQTPDVVRSDLPEGGLVLMRGRKP
jgi:uncharacterized caspase-like protein